MAFIAFPDADFFLIKLWRSASRVELESEMRGNLRRHHRAAMCQRLIFKGHDSLYVKAAPVRLRFTGLKREGSVARFDSPRSWCMAPRLLTTSAEFGAVARTRPKHWIAFAYCLWATRALPKRLHAEVLSGDCLRDRKTTWYRIFQLAFVQNSRDRVQGLFGRRCWHHFQIGLPEPGRPYSGHLRVTVSMISSLIRIF